MGVDPAGDHHTAAGTTADRVMAGGNWAKHTQQIIKKKKGGEIPRPVF